MRPIVADGVAWSVSLSVCHGNRKPYTKTAEPIEMSFGTWTRADAQGTMY